MSAQELADILEAVQSILDDYLLEGGEAKPVGDGCVVAEAQRGTLEAPNNLAAVAGVRRPDGVTAAFKQPRSS